MKEILRKKLPVKLFYFLMHTKNLFLPTKEYLTNQNNIKKSKNFYSAFIKENETVFDVGANFGGRVNTFLSLKAKVIAVEPQAECIKFLKSMYGSKIILIEKGLASKEGVLKFYMSSDTTISSFSEDWVNDIAKKRFKDSRYEKTAEIPVTTLDNLIQKFGSPAFVKIDVEGFELDVLKGLSNKIKYLSFEYVVPEKKETVIKCINHLELLGSIEINYSEGESMELSLKEWVKPAVFFNYLETEKFKSESAGDIYINFLSK